MSDILQERRAYETAKGAKWLLWELTDGAVRWAPVFDGSMHGPSRPTFCGEPLAPGFDLRRDEATGELYPHPRPIRARELPIPSAVVRAALVGTSFMAGPTFDGPEYRTCEPYVPPGTCEEWPRG